MSRESYKAIERAKKIGAMSMEQQRAYLESEKRHEPESGSADCAPRTCSAAIYDSHFKIWWRGDGWTHRPAEAKRMTEKAANKLKADAWKNDNWVQVVEPPNAVREPSRTHDTQQPET